MSELPPGGAVRFRPYWTSWLAIAFAVVLLVVSVFAAVRLQGSQTGSSFGISDQISMAGLGVVLALAALVPARPLVRADADGVSVRNMLFGRRFDWQEIRAVSFPDGALFPRLELQEDEYYSVQAVQAVDRERAVDAVRTLRRLHRAALPAAAASGDAASADAGDAADAVGERDTTRSADTHHADDRADVDGQHDVESQ